jgi:RND family efflux transporter MFP subunit
MAFHPSNSRVAISFLPLALLVLSGCSKEAPIQAKQDAGPIQVRVAPVTARDIRRVVQSIGTLFPYDETIVSAEIEGRVTELTADLGDSVAKGQPLVRISDEEQRYMVAQNEAQLRMALERVGLKNEDERIKDIREASEVRRAQADLFDAEQRYKRARSLVDQGIGAQADLDEAQARLNAMQAAYDQAVNQARNLVQEIQRVKAALDLQKKKLRDTTVYSPFAGKVKERQVTPGQVVRVNTPLYTIVKTDPIRLRLEVPERLAPWIKNGQVVEISLEAYENRKFQGKVWRISPTVDQTKRTFIVEALISNPGGDLKPGSYARATLPTNKTEHIKLIPNRAIAYVFGSNKAYVVNNGVIEVRDLKLGDRFDEDVEIVEGLEQGEQVAITQLNRLDTGTKVSIASGPAPAGSKKAD